MLTSVELYLPNNSLLRIEKQPVTAEVQQN